MSAYKLADKTAVLSGNFSLCLQSITSQLTAAGVNVALLTQEPKSAERFCQSLNDLREVSEHYGRAAVLEKNPLRSSKKEPTHSIYEQYFSKTAELFGTIDIYIDLNLYDVHLPLFQKDLSDSFLTLFAEKMSTLKETFAAANKFIRTRNRGRIICLLNELDMLTCNLAKNSSYEEIKSYVEKSAQEIFRPPYHATMNLIAVGVSEEYLIHRYPQKKSIQESLKELNTVLPTARLVEHNDISNLVLYLASPQSSGVNGQMLHINHGFINKN